MSPGFDALDDRERGDGQPARRHGPPPAEPGVQGSAQQGGGCRGCGQSGLDGVGQQRTAAQCLPGMTLEEGQYRHDAKRRRRNGQAGRGVLCLLVAQQFMDALGQQVRRPGQEDDPDQTDRPVLGVLLAAA